MALTPSNMLPLGTPLPPFALVDCFGKSWSSREFADKPLLVAFICNHCPYVRHIADSFSRFTRHYREHGLQVIAINSNDYHRYTDDSPEKMRAEVAQRQYEFPYLVDETQLVARAFDAACTPDFFLFDADGKLAYRGQYDDSRPGNQVPVTGRDLRAACDAVLAGTTPAVEQKASIGCNIKWRP